MTGPFDVLVIGRAVQLWVQVVAPLALGLLDFYWNAMGVGPGILANAGYLPGHFHPGFAAGYLELVVRHFLGNVQRSETANASELVAVVLVERPEPFGQVDDRLTVGVKHDVAVVDVHHVRRFDKGVVEVLVGGIQRIINLERAAALAEISRNVDIACKESGEAIRQWAVSGPGL